MPDRKTVTTRGASRTVREVTLRPKKKPALKKPAAKQSSAASADSVRMRDAFALVARPVRRLSNTIPCSKPLTGTSGNVEFDYARTYSSPAMVAILCNGFKFGTGVPVVFTKTATGWSFKGGRPFCHVKKCSNGSASTDTTSVSGTIVVHPWETTMKLTYYVHAYCGGELTCIEVGHLEGKQTGSGGDPLDATFSGPSNWSITCCPDRVWKKSLTGR